MASSSSRKLPLLFLLLVLAAFFHAAAAVSSSVPPPPPPAREYCCDTLAGIMECRSFVFGGAKAPSRACCAAYGAVYASNHDLCLCYVEDGTFWRAAGYDVDNATSDSFRIPERCGQVSRPPIEFWCEESGMELPPYGPQGTPAPPVQSSPTAAAVPTAQPPAPSGSSVAVAPPTIFTSPPPTASKAKRDSSPELLMLLVAVAAVCSIV